MKIKVISENSLIGEIILHAIEEEYKFCEVKKLDSLTKILPEEIENLGLICLIIDKNRLEELKISNELKKINKNIKILVVSFETEKNLLHQIIQYNIDGYMTINLTKEELIFVINMILRGRKYFDSKIILESIKKDNHLRDYNLTCREKDVLNGIIKGLNNKDIAIDINISEYTVKRHVSNILNKLKFKNRKEIIIHMKEHV